MSTQTWKGPVVPEAGDDLLAAWTTFTDTAGIVTTAASIAAARVLLTSAESAGHAPTSAHPAYLDIGGILYRADGTKTGSVWALRPVSEVEGVEGTYTGGGETITRPAAGQSALITSALPARPYDRLVIAWGMVAGTVTAGQWNAVALIRNTDGQLGPIGSGGIQSGSTFNMGYIPAGTDPQIILGVRAGSASTNTIAIAASAAATKLVVLAYPITMA